MATKSKHYCDGCIYQGWIGGEQSYCKYIFVMDKRRPCPPGDGCTERVMRGKTDKQVKKEIARQKKIVAMREWRAKKKAERVQIAICVNCGKRFETTDTRRKHCSPECAAEYRHKAQLEHGRRKR